MIVINMQYFGSGGAASGKGSVKAGGAAGGAKSQTSTGGKLIKESEDQYYGENDNGSYAVILDTGKSDYNMYKYGNKQIYEVQRGISDEARKLGATDPKKLYAYTKSEAMNLAKGWLKSNK